MAEFISTFTTGFSDLVKKDLPKKIKGVSIINIFDGLVHYKFDGNSRDLSKIIYFNNTFFVIKTFSQQNISFPQMVNNISNQKSYFLLNKGSFRVRFVKENQFSKVDKNISKKAEEVVLRNSKLTLDRLSPSTEVWYSTRRENFAFCGQLIIKREFTEKNLHKGELRPEIAYFLSIYAEELNQKVVMDCFAGYGAIPLQIVKNHDVKELIINDISKELVDNLKKQQIFINDKIRIYCEDAFKIEDVKDKSVDVVITDPPWGYYEDIGDITLFYQRMFQSFKRVLKNDGRIILLSARTDNLIDATSKECLRINESIHTLKKKKKASLYNISL